MKKLLLSLLTLTFLVSCASYKPPDNYNFPKTRTYNLKYDYVWSKVIEWFGSKNTPIKNLDKASGFISTEYNLDVDKYDNYCDCGTYNAVMHLNDIRGNFNVIIRKISDTQTQVTINTFFKAYFKEMNAWTGQYYVSDKKCNSIGKLEGELFTYINNKFK